MTNALELWRDPIWQSIGVLVAVVFGLVTSVLTVVTLHLTRRRKALTYEVMSVTPLAASKAYVEGKALALFDLEHAHNAQELLVQFENAGNMPIVSSDFERPVRVILNESAKILTADIAKFSPKSLTVGVQQEGTSVILLPALLNSRDRVTLRIVAADFAGDIAVDGRIAGVANIRELQSSREVGKIMFWSATAVTLVASLLGPILPLFGVEFEEPLWKWAIIANFGQIAYGLFSMLFPKVIDRFDAW